MHHRVMKEHSQTSARFIGGIVGPIALLALMLPGCSGSSGGSGTPTAGITATATAAASPTPAATTTVTPSPMPTPSPVAFVPNTFAFWDNPANWTTSYGPAYADILLKPTNFVPCLGGPFALCYYSGPQPETCTITPDGRFADCECFAIQYGQYFVDINAILNYSVYLQTIAMCGPDGANCQTVNSAPVCQAINQGNLIPGADMISTFSFDCVSSNGLGQTDCPKAVYAGCMTSACHTNAQTAQTGLVDCQCPTFDGPYQLGETLPAQECTLGSDLVWSAAYTPPGSTASPAANVSINPTVAGGGTYPQPPSCVPDAPGGVGCPLYLPGQMLPPNSGVDCTKVCNEYNTCINQGTQTGYTCDSALCTQECNDTNIVSQACGGLNQCDVSEIIKAETAASCSCCASQLCGCQPTTATNNAIFAINAQQRTVGIKPQCDINGTLCGAAPAN